jgi:ribonuclease E
VKDQEAKAKADEEAKLVAVEAKADTQEEVAVEAEAQDSAEQQPKQRRNRRSPRHLRASGQRRRRGRDRRPNPFRLRKGGVASPEMAMGKVMPSYGIIKPTPKQEKVEKVEVPVVETATVEATPTLGGFARPEMAMGKVIVRREEPVAEAAVEVENNEVVTQAPTVENNVVEVVETTENVEAAPIEVVIEQSEVTEPSTEQVIEVANSEILVPQGFKGHASAPMAKAPGNTEMKEITVVAAPLKEDRYQSRGAGSQVATNQAGAVMTKPQF